MSQMILISLASPEFWRTGGLSRDIGIIPCINNGGVEKEFSTTYYQNRIEGACQLSIDCFPGPNAVCKVVDAAL